MRLKGKGLLTLTAVLAALVATAVFLHLPAANRLAAHLHATHPIPVPLHAPDNQNGAPIGSATLGRALDGVAAIGRRWDAAAFDETVALFTDVHREIEWPGVIEPDTVHYGPDAQQTFELFRPEQGFSEPGPVFVFMHGNGLGNSDREVPLSDGLIWSHMGKLAATFGGIGLTMNYRNGAGNGTAAGAKLTDGAEDLRLVLEWIVANIAPYGGDPGTIVVLANSEGATRAAAYLFDEDLQMSSGPGIAAAILSSGLFGARAPEISTAVASYRGEHVPLALWSGEFDTAAVTEGIDALHEQLCRKYGDCPSRTSLEGHNHVSHLMSLGTAETFVAYALIRFYHTVR